MKKSNWTKGVSILLIAAMAATMAGCSGNGSANGSAGSGKALSPTKFSKPITLTWMSPTSDDYPLDSPALKKTFAKIAEATNVTVKWKMIPSSDAAAVYSTTFLADKSSWPNLTTKDLGTINGDGVNGAYVDLTSVMKEKMPNVYEKLNAYNRWGALVNLQTNQIFGIPRVGQQVCQKSWMIRKDWLDACGLKEPTSVEEFENALETFKEKNPGKAPANSNYPMICRGDPQNWMSAVYGSWGMNSIYYTEQSDGSLKLNLEMDNFRKCMEYWHDLYSKKLIDPECVVGDTNRWTSYMNNSYSGATIDYSVRTQQFTNAAQHPSSDAVAAGIKPQPMAALIGLVPLSSSVCKTPTICANDPINTDSSVGITSACSDAQTAAAMCLLNYIYSDEGSKLLSWGIDGVSYNGVDANGDPKWKSDLINNFSIKLTAQYGIQPSIARPLTKAETVMLFPGLAKEAADKNDGHYEKLHNPMLLTDAEQKEQGDIFTALSKFYIESCSKFLTGKLKTDDASWAAFQKQLKSINADRYLELTQQGEKAAADKVRTFKLG